MNIQSRSHRYQSSRETILSTSRDVFLRHGYIDASMDTIAQRSGVSKTTLYAHFESKEALFNQVVVDVVAQHTDDTRSLLELPPAAAFRDQLVIIARRMLDRLLDPEAIALMRLCVIEGARMPRLTYDSLIAARSNLIQVLVQFLGEQGPGAGLVIDDLRQAADLFVVLATRDFPLEAMLPWSAIDTPDARARNAERAADVMLRLYAQSKARGSASGTPLKAEP